MWITFDRHDAGISSLKAFHELLKASNQDPRFIKYCIITIHNALQEYLCIAVRQGNSFNLWKKKDLVDWLNKYELHEEISLPDLDCFLNLYKRLFNASNSIAYDQIRWLNETRNTLIHLNVDSLSFTFTEALKACSTAFQKVIETINLAQGVVFYNGQQRAEFDSITSEIKKSLEQTVF